MPRWLRRVPWGLLCLGLTLHASERIDPQHSQAKIAVRMRWLQTLDCNLKHFEMQLDTLADGRQRVSVRLDVSSLDIEGSAGFTRWAQSAEFLNVQQYPWVVFTSDAFAPQLLRDGGELSGELFLRGQLRPVQFTVKSSVCERPGRDCAIEASGNISRREFGMVTRPFAVRDKVKIRFAVRLQDATP